VSGHHAQRAADPLAVIRRWELGGAAVRALAAVAVVVAIGAGLLAWNARPDAEPVTPAPSDSDVVPGSPAPDTLVVAVSGKVQRPGLVRLPSGARVADALEAAGGPLPGTDLSALNLARKVTDGELIVVGAPAPGGAGGIDPGGLVNLNTATLDQLQTLPGVGPVLAQRIIDYRQQHGGFGSVADLRNVTGIGDARYNELKSRVTV
jgi:competence protein ComEA